MPSQALRLIKRTMDLLISGVMVLISVPVIALAVIAIKLDDGGRVLFRQVRIGLRGRPFTLYKLRTMSVMRSNPSGPDRLLYADPRLTRIGRLLRMLSLDELPQLFNVLVGDMSLVGPRPTLAYQVQEYNDFQRRRLEMKPGITGLAVVSGRNALSWEERIKLDVWYIDHWTMRLDISILFRTLWKVLVAREGLVGIGGVNDVFVRPDSMKEGEDSEL